MIDEINSLVLKERRDKLHRWKTWEPKTPFAPTVDAHVWVDSYGPLLAKELQVLIKETRIGNVSEGTFLVGQDFKKWWTKYNIFSWTEWTVLSMLRDNVYGSYVQYCKTLDVEPLDRKDIWIRGWFVRLEQGDHIGMHSHSLHENTFLSGNMSLSSNDTTTDYWIPLFSLYHGYFRVKNDPGNICLFPSWIQHRVDSLKDRQVRYTLAFDLFTKESFNYIEKTETKGEDLAKIILLSTKL